VADLIATFVEAIAVLIAAWLLFAAFVWLHRPTRDRAATLVRMVPDLARLAFRVARDRATPFRYRAVLVCLGLYLASPIDLIPDILPGIGSLDDVIIAAAVLRWVGRGVGRERVERHWAGSPEGLAVVRQLLGWTAVAESS
jgi:uncharacterized membrane protein YkvA (DUF1232 family)